MSKLLKNNINQIWSSLLINELMKNDITHFYISPGMRNAPLLKALNHLKNFYPNIAIHVCFDERSAAYRALGYSKATGKNSALICTSGTALANYLPAVIEAFKVSAPLVIVSADRPCELIFSDENQTIDQVGIFRQFVNGEMNFGAPNIEISPLAFTTTVSNLIFKSRFPTSGPVHINAAFREPLEDVIQEINENYIALSNLEIEKKLEATKYLDLDVGPNSFAVQFLTETIKQSKNGLIVVGSLPSYCKLETVRLFIEKLNWPFYLDISSSLKFEYNLNNNAIPTFDHPEVQEHLIKTPPDTVIHIGGRLTSKHYYTFLKKVPAINLISINNNTEKEDPSHHTKFRVASNIDVTLNELLLELKDYFFSSQKFPINFLDFASKKITTVENSPLSYPLVTKTLIDLIPDNSHLYIGNSTVVRSFDNYISLTQKKKITIATNRGVSGIEGFIASSIGFIDGICDEVYLVTGDITFMHDLNSLYYLKDSHIPLKIILINNKCGGIFTLLPINKEQDVINYITSPHQNNFHGVKEMFGLDYVKIDAKENLNEAFLNLFKAKKHQLLEIEINNNDNEKVYELLRTIKI